MKSIRRRSERTVSAETIARRADRGEDISGFFTNSGRMMAPIQRVNVDFAASMLRELDEELSAEKGGLNPGTSADLTAASLYVLLLAGWRP